MQMRELVHRERRGSRAGVAPPFERLSGESMRSTSEREETRLAFVGLNTAWPTGRLKGGGLPGSMEPEKRIGEDSELESSEMNNVWMEEAEVRRPGGWKLWEDRTEQRPGPLSLPRAPLIEYTDMTVNALDENEEGGAHIPSPEKDKYRRTHEQLRAVAEAREDQRKLAGGTYKCLEGGSDNFEMKIHRGYTSKVIGIVLQKIKKGKRETVFSSFASMRYEFFKFDQSGRRVRQALPALTNTGFIWEGFGGFALPLPSSDVLVYCERVDRDIHFSGEQCTRVREAPGASQMICSNSKCGLVVWHLSRKCFKKGEGQAFSEKWVEDFALVIFNDKTQELIWTHPHRKLKRSRWERLENSEQFEPYVIDQASKQRVESVIERKCLPEYSFSTPSYAPREGGWEDREPLVRQSMKSQWKFLAGVVFGLHVTPGRRLRPTMEKLKARSKSNYQPDSFEEALLNLLKNSNWSNSLQDLATSLNGFEDDNPCVMRNVDKLLHSLLESLAWADDYKLRDMAHRQELKFVMNYGEGGCVHKKPATEKHRCIQFSLRIPTRSTESLTAEQLEVKLGRVLKCALPEESCEECGTRAVRSCFLSIQQGCDPDFLTVVCDTPTCFSANDLSFLSITFSRSKYRAMSVVHWDVGSKKSSVSRVKGDGEWWWHGVEEGQAPSFKYSSAQVMASRHLQDAAVLMMVRVDDEQDSIAGFQGNAAEENKSGLGEESVQVNGPELLTPKKPSKKQRFSNGGDPSLVNLSPSKADEQVQEETERGQLSSEAADQFQRDTERAKALSSRDVNPLSPAEVLSKGVAFAAWQLGIMCRRPEISFEHNGNCIWTSVCHAMDPTLQGAFLEQAAWELRIKALGTVIAMFEQLSADEVEWLQAVSVKAKQTAPLTKEEIKSKLQSYMEGGQWSGELGDIIPQVVASFTRRALMIIELTYAAKPSLNIVRPGVVFDCGGEVENACPLMLVLQLNHFVPLHIAQCAQETALLKYKQWKISNRVNLGVEASNDGYENFHPPSTSTQRNRSHGHGADQGGGSEDTSSVAAGKRERSSRVEETDSKIGTQVGQ